jgi:hypothetical protein
MDTSAKKTPAMRRIMCSMPFTLPHPRDDRLRREGFMKQRALRAHETRCQKDVSLRKGRPLYPIFFSILKARVLYTSFS